MRSRRLLPLLLTLLPLCAQNKSLQPLAETLTTLRLRNAKADFPDLPTADLTTAKHQLRDWIETQLPPPEQTDDADDLARKLNQQLQTIAKPVNDEGNSFGDLGNVRLERDNAYLTVITGVGILCEYDESAYIYRNENGHWTRIFATEQTDYGKDRYQPQGLSAVYIHQTWADGKPVGTPFVLTLGNSWGCASFWHPVFYRVWRLDPSAPKLMIDGSEVAYFRGPGYMQGSIADLGTGSASAADVLIEYTTFSVDVGRLARQVVFHYQIKGDIVRRVAPVALGPRDFVDEWLTRDWSVSASWSESPTQESWHRRLRGSNGALSTFSETAKHCKPPDLWQIALELEDDKNEPPKPNRTYYFQVRWTPPYRFSLVAVSSKPKRNCTQDDPEADAWRTLFNTQGWR